MVDVVSTHKLLGIQLKASESKTKTGEVMDVRNLSVLGECWARLVRPIYGGAVWLFTVALDCCLRVKVGRLKKRNAQSCSFVLRLVHGFVPACASLKTSVSRVSERIVPMERETVESVPVTCSFYSSCDLRGRHHPSSSTQR